MNKYTKEDIEIFKRVIVDYAKISFTINTLIESGCDMQKLYDFLEQYIDCNITNADFNNKDKKDLIFEYIDFNYKDFNISILRKDNQEIYVGDTIEVWNDKDCYYIDTLSIKDITEIVKKENKNE